ncbi:unnamed protein product [Protopolystoma xenopodis]|uniref:Uncharacterized protein n=1 Tax=Protopolystoma xenopodis TaxID=117903 RepID=A0A3S5C5M5_9PLAT|nr:unnamed protein product [Protopolystoma xenopodis]
MQDLKHLKASRQVRDFQERVDNLLAEHVMLTFPLLPDKADQLRRRILGLQQTSLLARAMLAELDLSPYLSSNSLLMELLRSDIHRHHQHSHKQVHGEEPLEPHQQPQPQMLEEMAYSSQLENSLDTSPCRQGDNDLLEVVYPSAQPAQVVEHDAKLSDLKVESNNVCAPIGFRSPGYSTSESILLTDAEPSVEAPDGCCSASKRSSAGSTSTALPGSVVFASADEILLITTHQSPSSPNLVSHQQHIRSATSSDARESLSLHIPEPDKISVTCTFPHSIHNSVGRNLDHPNNTESPISYAAVPANPFGHCALIIQGHLLCLLDFSSENAPVYLSSHSPVSVFVRLSVCQC